jgi:predicted nuclease of predicted toxin-antitoxin system
MGGSRWQFLLDENVSRTVEGELDGRGFSVEHVVDALGPGVDDLPDILPYARDNDCVVVTKDYSDFGAITEDDHRGVVLIADHAHEPHEVATAIENIVGAYPSRDAFRSQTEFLDDWMSA